MDLSGLGSTLPPGLADAERDMGDKFRAAALSITNLYKSSLSYTKQAYNVGYSAALADVLSTVQSSIGAGQNAEQTLSRLMDWADARQAAISAFAAEDADDAPPPLTKRPSALARPGLNHLSAPARAASAPVSSNPGPSHIPLSSASALGPSEEKAIDRSRSPVPSSSRPSQVAPVPTVNSTPNTSIDSINGNYQPTPAGIMSSSPAASPSTNRHIFAPAPIKQSKALPMRYSASTSQRGESSASAPTSVPSSSFNPSIPSAGVPFVSFSSNQEGPAQNYPTGTKRPMLDGTSMDLDPAPAAAVPSTPVSLVSQRNGGRSTKRRSLGTGLGSKSEDGDGDGTKDRDRERERERERDRDKDRDRGERRRGGRRHGHSAGPGAV